MAVNQPNGDNARKGAVRKRSRLATKISGEDTWTKRRKETGEFISLKKRRRRRRNIKAFRLSVKQAAYDIIEAGAQYPADVPNLHEALHLAWQKLEARVRDRQEAQHRLARLIVSIGNRPAGAEAGIVAEIAERTFHPPFRSG